MKRRRVVDYKGYKDKMNQNIIDSKKLENFIPGMYIIFNTDFFNLKIMKSGSSLVFGKIRAVEKNSDYDYDNERYTKLTIIRIDIIDLISEIEEDSTFRTTTSFNINRDFKEILFINSSLKVTQNKYEEIKIQQPYCDWEMKRDSEKYNM